MTLNNVSKKACYLIPILAFLITFNLLAVHNSTVKLEKYNLNLPRNLPYSINSEDNSTIFGEINFNPEFLKTNESVSITSMISDPDGVKNATLHWEYISLNNSQYNTSMVIDSNAQVVYETDYSFSRTGYLTETGIETTTSTDWMFGETIFEGTLGEVFSLIDLEVIRSGGGGNRNFLTYCLVQAKNFTNNLWESRMEVGVEKGGTTEVSIYPATYSSVESVLGYRIFAITYIGTHNIVQPPRFQHLYLYRNEYSAVIPAPTSPSFVTCYINAYDELNQSSTSENTTFLMDWTPVVTVFDVPSVVKESNDLLLNVSVSDEDGYETINTTGVIAYYKIGDSLNWTSLKLDFIGGFATIALFDGTIPGQSLENIETSLYLMVNASDIVNGQKGYEGTSGVLEIILDNLNPRLIDLTFESEIQLQGIENSTSAASNVNITAQFEDPAGISAVNIFFSTLDDQNYTKIVMVNSTEISSTTIISSYFVVILATNITSEVQFFFETSDFLGNNGNSSLNYYYSDGNPPQIDDILIYPEYPTSFSDATILLNVSDDSGVRQSVLWYSYDSGVNWSNTVCDQLNYTERVDYEEVFSHMELPFLIKDEVFSQVSLDVQRRGGVDSAVLKITFNHEKTTDLRIWLVCDTNTQFLIFDREVSDYSVSLDIDLLELGLTQGDFDDITFTLLFQDFLPEYSGFLTKFTVELMHYSIPLNFEYFANIPQSGINTDILFFITLTDGYWNDINTSVYSYYSDGISPLIELTSISSPINLNGEHYIQVSASATDTTGILGVELYYRFSTTGEWKISSMLYDEIKKSYCFEVSINSEMGTLYYYIKAYDFSGLVNQTDIQILDYTNGLGPTISLVDTPYLKPLDLEGAAFIQIRANASDINGNITEVIIHYKFNTSMEWISVEMSFDPISGIYSKEIMIESVNGTLIFKIESTDDSGLREETDEVEISFIHGLEEEPISSSGIDPFFVLITLVSIVSISVVSGFGIRRILKNRNLRVTDLSNLPTPPATDDPPQ